MPGRVGASGRWGQLLHHVAGRHERSALGPGYLFGAGGNLECIPSRVAGFHGETAARYLRWAPSELRATRSAFPSIQEEGAHLQEGSPLALSKGPAVKASVSCTGVHGLDGGRGRGVDQVRSAVAVLGRRGSGGATRAADQPAATSEERAGSRSVARCRGSLSRSRPRPRNRAKIPTLADLRAAGVADVGKVVVWQRSQANNTRWSVAPSRKYGFTSWRNCVPHCMQRCSCAARLRALLRSVPTDASAFCWRVPRSPRGSSCSQVSRWSPTGLRLTRIGEACLGWGCVRVPSNRSRGNHGLKLESRTARRQRKAPFEVHGRGAARPIFPAHRDRRSEGG